MTCKSLLISVQGIEVLDLIFLAAKKKHLSRTSSLCVHVCVHECCSVFPSCLSNRKLMLGSTEDREEAFSFLCESFETERKKIEEREEKGEEGRGQRAQAAALIQPSAIFPSSPCLHFLHRLTIPALFSHSLCNFHPSYTPGLRGSAGLWGVHELCERTKEAQKVNEAGRCGEQSSRCFWFTMRLCIFSLKWQRKP